MQNRDFPLAIGMLFGVTAVTRWTPESAPSTGGTFRFLARSPDPICPRGGDPGSTGHLKALAVAT